MKGIATILSFPFRIYGQAFLPELDHSTNAFRIRIYPPFRVRALGSPLSPSVPIESWPQFEWHPKLPREQRLSPPKDLTPQPFGDRAYDALRVDAWPADAETAIHSFVRVFLAWLRQMTEQYWIGGFESDTDPMAKATFTVDDQGRALETPWIYAKFRAADSIIHPLTKSEWTAAFGKAIAREEPPTHRTLYLDARALESIGHPDQAILALALSLEVARNSIFPRFAPKAKASDTTLRLGQPFDRHDDLLRHLSTDLDEVLCRSLSRESPDIWTDIEDLYVARHHVAHGKRAIVREKGKVRLAEGQDVARWIPAARQTIDWIESLAPAA